MRGWKQFKVEPRLWHHAEHEALLLVHVGEFLLTTSQDKVETIKKEIEQKLEIRWKPRLQEDWIDYFGFDWRRGTDAASNPYVECRVKSEYVDRLLREHGFRPAMQ